MERPIIEPTPPLAAVVTGGGRGIGRAIAIALAERGYRVLVVGRDAERLRATCAATARLEMAVADLGLADERARLIEHVGTWAPSLALLVNNAALQRALPVAATTTDEIEREIQVNLVAPLVLSAGLLPRLSAGAGTIVNVTSILALHPKTSAPVYCATKAGLRSFTNSLREQLRAGGVRVVELVPPLVDTDMTAGRGSGKIAPEAVAGALIEGLRRGARRVDVGRARLFRRLDRLSPRLAARVVRDT